jgi:hypothetical protein
MNVETIHIKQQLPASHYSFPCWLNTSPGYGITYDDVVSSNARKYETVSYTPPSSNSRASQFAFGATTVEESGAANHGLLETEDRL